MKKILIFASGSGSNAENIFNYFKDKQVEIVAIFTNNKDAYVIERAKKLGVAYEIFNRDQYKSGEVLHKMKSYTADLVVLAGFLWLIPKDFITQYPNKIINVHPALLPKFGGKGMYGSHVHKAVVEAGEKESGITIHFVNEKYDEGNIIFQASCPVEPTDKPDDVANKIHALEFEHFPAVIEKLLFN